MDNNPQEQLNLVNKAIAAILDGAQEYQIGNRRIKRAELSLLLTERNRIEKQLCTNDGMFLVRFEGR